MCRIGLLVAIATLALAVGCPEAPAHSMPTLFDSASRLPALSRGSGGPLGDIQWTEHEYSASTTEVVDVSVSPSYPADEPIGQRWADFFAALPPTGRSKSEW
jgi:hypothetical protein